VTKNLTKQREVKNDNFEKGTKNSFNLDLKKRSTELDPNSLQKNQHNITSLLLLILTIRVKNRQK